MDSGIFMRDVEEFNAIKNSVSDFPIFYFTSSEFLFPRGFNSIFPLEKIRERIERM